MLNQKYNILLKNTINIAYMLNMVKLKIIIKRKVQLKISNFQFLLSFFLFHYFFN